MSNHDGGTGGSGGRPSTCTLSHEGDLVVRTPAELAALRDHRLVTGDLIVDCPECTSLEPLECLEEVGKMLSIVGCDSLESLEGLSALRRAGMRAENGGLAIGFYFVPWETAGNARLRTLAGLGPLESVEGRIDIRKNPELRDLSALAGLTNVAGALFLNDNDALGSLEDLSELRSARGVVEIADNDALVDLTGLGAFSSARALWISENDALVTLAGLDNFWGGSSDLAVSVVNNALLGDVTALEHLQGTLHDIGFRGNASLREVRLNPGLSILSGGLGVGDNAVLETFEAPGLTHVAQGINLEKNPLLASLDLGAPTSAGSVMLYQNGALRDTSALADVRLVTGTVIIEGNTALERVTLPELQEVGDSLRIGSNQVLTELELGALRRAATVQVTRNPLLPSCLVTERVAAVTASSAAQTCGNAPDECASECPPRP